MINIIATDLDGTLLDDQHHFDQKKFTQVLARIKQTGGHLIIASGEQLDWCEQHFAQWAQDLSFVAANGAVVADRGGHVIFANQLSPLEISQVDHALSATNINQYVIGSIRGGCIMNAAPYQFKQIMRFYYPHLTFISDWQSIKQPVVKVAVAVSEGRERQSAEKLNQQLGPGLHAVVGGNGELDILKVTANKATAVKKLLNYFHRPASDLLAFGDQLNDTALFKLAGQSCAVANAVPEIKQMATNVIPSNNEGGVLQELSQRFC